MTTNPITLADMKASTLRVISYMATGLYLKDACKMEGIDEKTFAHRLAKFPEIHEAMTEEVNAQMGEAISAMIATKKQDMESLTKYASFLRERLEANPFDDKAAKMLMQVDAHIDRTMNAILPTQKQKDAGPVPDNGDRTVANKLLADMRGAKRVHIERITEQVRYELGDTSTGDATGTGEIVEGDVSEAGTSA